MNSLYPEYNFTSHFANILGNTLHYIDEGQGPVIVMVHGNPTWSYYYRNLISLLSRNYRVIAVDNIGCGLSDKPQDYDYKLSQHIDNLHTLLNEIDVSSYSLIVHDWGGAIGMGLATRYPERLEKIVVLNTAAFLSTRIPFRISLCKLPVIGPIIVRGFNGFARPATFMAVSKPLAAGIAAAYLAPYNNWNNRVAVSAFVQDIPLSDKHPSYRTLQEIDNNLSTIRDAGIPMLILWGGKDFCFDKVFYDEWLKRFPDAERHYFEDGGHYILEDKLDEIKPILSRFFTKHEE
ncbi:alpha/beta fold hydrolase [Desulfosediminicola sp.]|uniref:alpha/beta fold hydrolase n=1 Tax=Desulfosediminicola sp. TaxID=2886825 RepID=UPI003AF26E0E